MPDPSPASGPQTPYSKTRIEELIGLSFSEKNRVRILESGNDTFQKILDSVSAARNIICAEFYIFRDDDTGREFAEKLKEKSRQGVRVYILYDHFGSFRTSRAFWSGMEKAGIKLRASHPFIWTSPRRYVYRNHKKLLLIDGEKAFTGGFNIADESHGFRRKQAKVWRDTGIFLKGPIAAALLDIFMESWAIWKGLPFTFKPKSVPVPEGVPVIPIFARSGRARRRMRRLLFYNINSAQKSIDMTTAYFMPGRRILKALEQAARRGVILRLLLPGKTDVPSIHYAGRAFYRRLLKAGVAIYTYQGPVLHAKTAVFDGCWSIIGSTNLDFQSLRRNEESNVGILNNDFGARLTGVFHNDLALSKKIEADTWTHRPFYQRLLEKMFSLVMRRLLSQI
jgi:cardiolipin synthase